MKLLNKMIHVECTGPYVWYIHGCEIDNKKKLLGILQLRVQGRETPVSSFMLNSTDDCRGLHSFTFLKAGDLASVHLHSEKIQIKGMSMGLTYLLGNKCDYWWVLITDHMEVRVGAGMKKEVLFCVHVTLSHDSVLEKLLTNSLPQPLLLRLGFDCLQEMSGCSSGPEQNLTVLVIYVILAYKHTSKKPDHI